MTSEPLVEIRRATVVYKQGSDPVLVNADLTIEAGDFVGVVGPSGSGKTTLLRLVLGAIRPVAGHVTRRPRVRIGYVPQVEAVNWSFPITVGECVLMSRSAGRWTPWSTRAERDEVREVLDRLGIGGLENRHIRALSGGQQQRVFIARALLNRPDLLLMDEPTAGVDVRTRHDVLHLLGDLHAEGLSVLVTTHDLNGVAAHLPHLVCLNKEVVADGRPEDVLTADVLERTYGAPMEVLEHGGMPLVIDRLDSSPHNIVRFHRRDRKAT